MVGVMMSRQHEIYAVKWAYGALHLFAIRRRKHGVSFDSTAKERVDQDLLSINLDEKAFVGQIRDPR
jgi:hypothetical protein